MEDLVGGRKGPWMHTSLGGRFFPGDPRPEEVFISDIANGLALDCRYAGQGRVDRFYSVAEHSVLVAQAARRSGKFSGPGVLAALLHDAAEAYINDLNRATKQTVGAAYKVVENRIMRAVDEHFGLTATAVFYRDQIKDLDMRMVPLEKDAIMRHPQSWAYDAVQPLRGTKVLCLSPVQAKEAFIREYWRICAEMEIEPEEVEL